MPKRKIPGVTVSSSNSKPKVLGSDETLDPSKTIDASSSDDNQDKIAPVETVPTTETVSANRLESETTTSSEAKKPEPVEHASRPEHTVGQHPLKTRFFNIFQYLSFVVGFTFYLVFHMLRATHFN